MLDIDEMGQAEIQEVIDRVGYGHLGFIHEGKPSVMPMQYYLQDADIYLFTTIGMKTHDFEANSEICLQIEEIQDRSHWCSVIVNGRVERLTEKQDIDRAIKSVKEHNPTLSPAIARTWLDSWGHSEAIRIYRVERGEMSGRTTDGASSQ
jgi:uncharacterized protein